MLAATIKTHQRSVQKGNKKILSHAGEDHAVNMNLCVKLVVPFIFADIQRVKIWLFNNKSDGVSFVYRWFIYVTMEQSIVPGQGHLIFLSFLKLLLHWHNTETF